MNIVSRYLILEIFKSSIATILVLFVILMTNSLSSILSEISMGDAPDAALVPLMLKQASYIMSMVIPFGFYLGVVFAFGRLYKDYEISVLNSCGLGYRQMLYPVLVLAIPFFLVNALFSLSLSASALRYSESIVDSHENEDEFEQIQAGRFNVSKNADHVFYMEEMSDDRIHLKNVIIAQSSNDFVSIEVADAGVQIKDKKTGDLFLDVGPGTRYEGFPGDLEFTVMKYQTHGILMDLQNEELKREIGVEEKSFLELYSSTAKEDKIEMQWRIAVPIALLVLSVLAVPVSYVAPRKGRYGKMGVAVFLYILYVNIMGVVLTWVEQDFMAVEFAFWFVHLGFLSLSFLLMWHRNKGFQQLRAAL